MSTQEEAVAGVFSLLTAALSPLGVSVLRDAYLPQTIPAPGLVVLHWGEPGEPDVLLNPYTEYYQHRTEVEIFVTAPADPEAEAKEETIANLYTTIKNALTQNPSLSGKAIYSYAEVMSTEPLDIEGAPEILAGTFELVIEYETRDLLA